jgi:hypothetical protein
MVRKNIILAMAVLTLASGSQLVSPSHRGRGEQGCSGKLGVIKVVHLSAHPG